VETFLGALPPTPRPAAADSAARAAAAAMAKGNAERLRQWRLTADPSGAKAFRKKYEDAGMLIEIVKFDNIYAMADGELDFAFALAKALGARAISCEISTKDDDLRRVGRFADKHQMMVGYHGHTKVTPAIWENAFSLAKYNGANVDIGHFIAGNNYSPVEFIKKHHDRITHVHIKDRKLHEGPNVPFGQGDTPIVEVLRLIRDNGWPMQATIEFEYPVPAGSDRMTEIARALKYCRDALA
jgi:sugar phosphate isomerase/epimerase